MFRWGLGCLGEGLGCLGGVWCEAGVFIYKSFSYNICMI